MKIVSWNCNGAFREDFKAICEEDADIYVIQECEDPEKKAKVNKEAKKFEEYKEFAGKNYFWIGNDENRGLGIFAKDGIKLEEKEKWEFDLKYFILLRVNDSFDLLGVWAMPEYVEMFHDFIDANPEIFKEDLIICGDFNSNVVFNDKHKTKDKNGEAKDHTHLDKKLNEKGLYSIYHKLTGKCNGEESHFTFFQARHLNVPFYLDYFYAHEKIIDKAEFMHFWKRKANDELPNKFKILDKREWINLSDHLPIIFEFEI